MALDFPANPVDGEAFASYVWNESVGVWQGREESATVAVMSPTAPVSANNGDIWFNTSLGLAYVYYDDGTSGQWVQLIASSGQSIESINDITDVNIVSPADGQILTYNDATGEWVNATIDVSATVISDSAPGDPQEGDAWFDSSSGFLYIYYSDGTSGQWVEVKANSADTAALEARIDTLESKSDFPIQLNTQTINANYTIPAGYNGMSAGPIVISSGVVVTIPAGSSWSIV
jgi:hypothetical protein